MRDRSGGGRAGRGRRRARGGHSRGSRYGVRRRRCTSSATAARGGSRVSGPLSRVDQLAQTLADLEEWHPLLGHVHGAPRLRVAALAGVAVTDAEAAEAPELDLVALGESVGDVVE